MTFPHFLSPVYAILLFLSLVSKACSFVTKMPEHMHYELSEHAHYVTYSLEGDVPRQRYIHTYITNLNWARHRVLTSLKQITKCIDL